MALLKHKLIRSCNHCLLHGTLLDGNSGNLAHVTSNLCHLIRLRHLIISREVRNRIFFSPRGLIFFHACEACSELSSYVSSLPLPLLTFIYHSFSLAGIHPNLPICCSFKVKGHQIFSYIFIATYMYSNDL